MSSALPDVFERFATQCGIRVNSEPLIAAPRDVLTPIEETDQHHLSTLTREQVSESVRLVFITPVAVDSRPSVRDLLWWLAADAFAIQRCEGNEATWAATYGYPPEAESTPSLFRQHQAQARKLLDLLGRSNFDVLLALYESEVSPSGRG